MARLAGLRGGRRAALAVFLVAMAVTLLVIFVRAAERRPGYVFVNAATTSFVTDRTNVLDLINEIGAGQRLCTGPVRRPVSFDSIAFSLASRRKMPTRDARPRLRVALRRGGPRGPLIRPPATARVASTAIIWRDDASVPVGHVPRGAPIEVCIHNAGRHPVVLMGGPSVPTRGGVALVDGVPVPNTPQLLFQRDPEPTLLSRVPAMMSRAAVFRPEWMGAWTFWLMAAIIVLGVPALLARALWTSLVSWREEPAERASAADEPTV